MLPLTPAPLAPHQFEAVLRGATTLAAIAQTRAEKAQRRRRGRLQAQIQPDFVRYSTRALLNRLSQARWTVRFWHSRARVHDVGPESEAELDMAIARFWAIKKILRGREHVPFRTKRAGRQERTRIAKAQHGHGKAKDR